MTSGRRDPSDSSSFVPDWDAARQRVRTSPWAARILQRVREDFTWWRSRVVVPGPGADSEWTHHYFCAEGTRLSFDPERPHHHECAECGRVYSGELLDGAWRTQMHNAAASQAQRAVLLLRLGDDEQEREAAREELLGLLARYARDYELYPVHGDKVGQGKVMPQNLDESIWAIALLRAVRWGGELLPARAGENARILAAQVASLLEPQLGMVHNIHCWILAALAECGVRSGDRALLERVRQGPFGIETQIRDGFRREGLWYETSAFYHYYALAALLSYREATGIGGLSTEEAETLARAVEAPATLAYMDGLLPAYGDCWPLGHLEDFAGHVAVATVVLPEHPVSGNGYRRARDRESPVDLWIGSRWQNERSRPLQGPASVAELVFGPGPLDDAPPAPDRGSFLWPDAGIGAVVSERARITMRFGPDVGMHDHRDKLAVDVEIPGVWRSLDLGSGGYTAEATRWMQSPAAHNIGTLHDERQPPVDGTLREGSEDRLVAELAWDGQTVRRTIQLTPDGWTDDMELSTEEPGPLMWIFHGDGAVRAAERTAAEGAHVEGAEDAEGAGDPGGRDLTVHGMGLGQSMPWQALGDLPGLQRLRDIRRLVPGRDGKVEVTWGVPGAPVASLTLPAGATAAAALGDGNPSGLPLGMVLVRVQAERHAHFSAQFSVPQLAVPGSP